MFYPASWLYRESKLGRQCTRGERKQAFPGPLASDIPHTGPTGSGWLQWPERCLPAAYQLHTAQLSMLRSSKEGIATTLVTQ